MKHLYILLIILSLPLTIAAQNVQDDFEGSGTITSWFGDACGMNNNFANPYQNGINNSAKVLEYNDTGGQYANVRFDVSPNFNFSTKNTFTLKIYVPSNGLTGSQTNQISLKLQDGTLAQPWITQSEIIKPIALNTWQEVSFNFETDTYINLDSGSLPPIQRTDFNRVVIQINGENNFDSVLAYLDDLVFEETVNNDPVYDNLVWSDDFDGSGAIDNSKWFHQTIMPNGVSWFNGEQQHYTDRLDNTNLSGGNLNITAKAETYTDQGVTTNYTSARLNSKFSFMYGRVEVRAKLPSIAGTWPAIWLLGKNINENGGYWDNQGFGNTFWPACGEIDIMEPNIPKNQILATWHWENGSGYMYDSSSVATTNADTSNNFHIYELVWSPDSMKIYMDGTLVNELDTIEPFNQEFYILLNVAMGGNLGGTIDSGFNEDSMEIDYVRVYQESTLSTNKFNTISALSFYPNPVKDKLNVTLTKDNEIIKNYEVRDVGGRLITKQHNSNDLKTILVNTPGLNNGLYFMTVYFESGLTETIKFIKQ